MVRYMRRNCGQSTDDRYRGPSVSYLADLGPPRTKSLRQIQRSVNLARWGMLLIHVFASEHLQSPGYLDGCLPYMV
jgi:hypothetical protein